MEYLWLGGDAVSNEACVEKYDPAYSAGEARILLAAVQIQEMHTRISTELGTVDVVAANYVQRHVLIHQRRSEAHSVMPVLSAGQQYNFQWR
jgi:hypothetical protein